MTDETAFGRLLGDGSRFGISLSYAVQATPDGLAQAFLLGEEFIGTEPVALVLGDNIFYGPGVGTNLRRFTEVEGGAIFAYHVINPSAYGVVEFDRFFRALSIEEKPTAQRSSYAVPGVYSYDNNVVTIAKGLRPSARGEYKITDANRTYLAEGRLRVKVLPAAQHGSTPAPSTRPVCRSHPPASGRQRAPDDSLLRRLQQANERNRLLAED